ncbi:MAG: hypothetical protein ACYSQZ_09120 [Planctomycetota bacterium]
MESRKLKVARGLNSIRLLLTHTRILTPAGFLAGGNTFVRIFAER